MAWSINLGRPGPLYFKVSAGFWCPLDLLDRITTEDLNLVLFGYITP